ncbi:hypothetical protein G7081_05830 [Vagococcus coleopterorum]|uniref:Uncharacterized protein n=1 Tax=Vagococcus coleopterorum TaxID=2714946 RepID=A0A6G8ANT0_9ENTE|nr:hypothetical protein [Vagococcus coleopterorum]QIL46629.1 hypothetical protein G7081_05830 [Vagococcus coleopterorum]
MTFQRFFVLFITYAFSIVVGYIFVSLLPIHSMIVQVILMTIIGFIVLAAPLTYLSFKKQK